MDVSTMYKLIEQGLTEAQIIAVDNLYDQSENPTIRPFRYKKIFETDTAYEVPAGSFETFADDFGFRADGTPLTGMFEKLIANGIDKSIAADLVTAFAAGRKAHKYYLKPKAAEYWKSTVLHI